MHKKSIIYIYIFLSALSCLFTQTPSQYPEILELNSRRDHLFKQFSQAVEHSYKEFALDNKIPFLNIYIYKAKSGDTLMDIAARCMISYETIATLNRISDSKVDIAGYVLLLPTVPGLFIPKQPENDLENLLYANRENNQMFPDVSITVKYPNDVSVHFGFYPDMKLTPTERTFFLIGGFRFPLPGAVLTSAYGLRENPVTGTYKFHEGIDLAAKAGTPVMASRSGLVKNTGFSVIYGNYIILEHDNGMESFYAHLRKILVEKNQKISSGYVIGEVGSTGQSTGPHLHFEIWVHGNSKDPAELLKLNQKRI